MNGFLSTPLSVAIATIAKKYQGHWDTKNKGWVFPKDVAGDAIAEISKILEDHPRQNWKNRLAKQLHVAPPAGAWIETIRW